ncbi:MAG: lipopolysaccharide heptosyltransferase II [Bacteroidetes bacterium]|nr:lipopolysaccharide heptosyltransferase II [Bacteroidota bacterium]
MTDPKRILVFQTAFLGDVILTLPMIQVLHAKYPQALIDVVTTPAGSEFLSNHPAIAEIIKYDKRRAQKGLRGILALSIFLNRRKYNLAVVPHRSFRTSFIMALSGIPQRIGFSTASGTMFYHHIIRYDKTKHEVERNLSLLIPLGITSDNKELPTLYPSHHDVQFVNKFLFEREILEQTNLIAIAPGSVWNTKRWLPERFSQLARMLANDGYQILIVGGKEDAELGQLICETSVHKLIHNAAGKMTLLQSAELLRRCCVLVTNDSAPLHIGVAMRIPVVAIFGATVPEFGFAPYGDHDRVVETKGLSCRPCAIHGGQKCPIGTFVCMKNIDATMIHEHVISVLSSRKE